MNYQHYINIAKIIAMNHNSNEVYEKVKRLREDFIHIKGISDDIIIAEYNMYNNAFEDQIASYKEDMFYYPNKFIIAREEKYTLSQGIANLEYAQSLLNKYIQDINNKKPQTLKYEELPEFLTNEDLTKLFGWAPATIATKRSRQELPFVDGMMLYPKKEVFDMLKSKIRNPFVNYNDIIEKELKAQANKKSKK